MLVTGAAGLEVWCRMVTGGYQGVTINNMTESWRDGLGFCAIIHRFRPTIIDYSQLQPGQIIRNCELAFSIAEKSLGIPSLLDPQDMLESSQLDRLSILTYVSQFYHKFSKESPTPAARKSIIHTTETNTASMGKSTKDDENNNTCTDVKDLEGKEQIPNYSSSVTDGYFSSSSPYSSSSSSGCYQIVTANDSQEWMDDEKSSLTKNKVSSESSVQLSSKSPHMTGGKLVDTTSTKCLHKSSKSTNMSESSATHWNARKPKSDQTFTDFPDRPASGISVFNYRQLPTISPTPSSSSSKASVANELIFGTNTPNDSGLDQSSVMSLTSSPSSSRLSSVSPSLEKMNRNSITNRKLTENTTSQKYPKEKNIEILNNDHIKTTDIMNNRNHETTELIKDRRTTFKETLTKFNSLCHLSGHPASSAQGVDKMARLRSQGSQTEDHSPQVVSQQCQTEESHLSCSDQTKISGRQYNHNNQQRPSKEVKNTSHNTGRLTHISHVNKVNYATHANQRHELGAGVPRYNRSRRNNHRVPSTNTFYSSVYRNHNYFWSNQTQGLPYTQGVQSTLV